MASTKQTSGIGVLALLAGAAIGAFGVWATLKPEGDDSDTLTLDLSHEGDSDPIVEVGEYENVTPDTTTLLDSLEGLEVPGTEADLVYVRVLGLERAKLVAMWGYKGLNGNDPTKFQRLADLTTEHLLNIKANSTKVTKAERRIIDSILEDRVASGEVDAAVLDALNNA